MSNSDDETQTTIEKELFEEYDKALEKTFSLTKFVFVVFGFYGVILNDMHNGLNKNIFINAPDPDISTWAIFLCVISITLAVIYLFRILSYEQKYKFKRLDGSIQYRTGKELKENNLKLFSEIKLMNSRYKTSIVLIGVSLAFFGSYFRPSLFFSVIAIMIPTIIEIVSKTIAKIIYYLKLSVS